MELHLIIFFMICASLVAVEIRDLISSVIALSAVGLGLSLAFLIMKAPNLAIAQLVIEIICVIVLIRSTINKDLPVVRDGRWLFNTIGTLLFILCFLLFAYFALRELPRFGFPLMRVSQQYIFSAMENTGSSNVISAITTDFRRYDAMIEGVLLFTAVIAVLSIVRRVGKANEE